jgi:hypothetical protein
MKLHNTRTRWATVPGVDSLVFVDRNVTHPRTGEQRTFTVGFYDHGEITVPWQVR